MKKKDKNRSCAAEAAVFIAVGLILIADTVFVSTRSSMNLGVMLPAMIGAPMLLIGLAMPIVKKLTRKSRFIRVIAFIVSLVYLLGFTLIFVTTGLILVNSSEPDDGADVLIVLGGGIRGRTPTLTLKYRLDSAYEYLERNPATVVIVSGGQGDDEVCPESEVMKSYLVGRGISGDRIIEENESKSTEENFRFSKAITDELFPGGTVVFTTTRFHVFRSELVAKKEGLNAEGIPAKGVWYITPNDYLRECAAITVYFLKGKI